MNSKELNDWAYKRLMARAEAYFKDAEYSVAMGWKQCALDKLNMAEFCLTLAEQIRKEIQEF